MTAFILRRVVVLIATLFAVSVMSFSAPFLGGGDPARAVLRARVEELALNPAAVEAVREKYGLDEAIYVQYYRWMQSAVQGDFGNSFVSDLPAMTLVWNGLKVTFLLTSTALLIALVAAVPLGIVAAWRAGSKIDTAIIVSTQGLVAIPEYWLAPLGMLVFAVWLGVLPAAGWQRPAAIVLPALVLSLRPLAYLLGVTRASMIKVLASPYMTAARSRGLSQMSTLRRHGLKNSMVPVMTFFTIWLAGSLGGSVIVEVIFNIPGLGRVLYNAIINVDVAVIQAGVVVTVVLAIVINTLTDIAYAFLNPAVVVGESHG